MGSPIVDGGDRAAQPFSRDAMMGDPDALATGVYALPKSDFTLSKLLEMPPSFRDKVEVNYRGCWIWKGAKYGPGYAQYRVPGGERMTAHKYAYEKLIGPIPSELECDHMCGVRSCVCAYHIKLDNHSANCLRRTVSIRKALRETLSKIQHAMGSSGTPRTLWDLDAQEVAYRLKLVATPRSIGDSPTQDYRYPHTEKRCPTCGITKPVSEFYRVRDWSASFKNYWYPAAYCKPCYNARTIRNSKIRRSRKVNR